MVSNRAKNVSSLPLWSGYQIRATWSLSCVALGVSFQTVWNKEMSSESNQWWQPISKFLNFCMTHNKPWLSVVGSSRWHWFRPITRISCCCSRALSSIRNFTSRLTTRSSSRWMRPYWVRLLAKIPLMMLSWIKLKLRQLLVSSGKITQWCHFPRYAISQTQYSESNSRLSAFSPIISTSFASSTAILAKSQHRLESRTNIAAPGAITRLRSRSTWSSSWWPMTHSTMNSWGCSSTRPITCASSFSMASRQQISTERARWGWPSKDTSDRCAATTCWLMRWSNGLKCPRLRGPHMGVARAHKLYWGWCRRGWDSFD